MAFWNKKNDYEMIEYTDEELELMNMYDAIERAKEERKELEKKLAEERRIAAEKRKEEEAKRAAEEARRLEEEARIAEEIRKAEEARQREIAARLEEEARIFDEAKKAVEVKLARKAILQDDSVNFSTDEIKEVTRNDIGVYSLSRSDMKNPHLCLGKKDKKFALGWYIDEDGEVQVYFYSHDKQIRALEFMEFMVAEYGKATGNATYAQTTLSKLVFKVLGRPVDEENVEGFLEEKVTEYFTEYDWMYTLGMVDDAFLQNMRKYKKKNIPWAYVRTTDILPKGEKFRIKMLENESEVELTSNEATYIMIGIKGEVYNIAADKFADSYETTYEMFDICDITPIYLPSVYSCVTNKRISLDDKAYVCTPKENRRIYAKQLERRTKVFSVYNNGEYFVGKMGDYLVVREDDHEDVYIVQKEIFSETYEKVIDA